MSKPTEHKWLIATGAAAVVVVGLLVWLLTGGLATKDTPVASGAKSAPASSAPAKKQSGTSTGGGSVVAPKVPSGGGKAIKIPTVKPKKPASFTASARIITATTTSATVEISGKNVGGTAGMPRCTVTIQGARTSVLVNSTVYPNQGFIWTAFGLNVGASGADPGLLGPTVAPAAKPTSANVTCS